MQNFMIADMASITFALIIWLCFSISQGYLIGYLTNAFSFRACSFSKRLTMSLLLFIGVVPGLFNYIALLGGVKALVFASALFAFASLALVAKDRRRFLVVARHIPRYLSVNRLFLTVALAWYVLSVFMLIDIQVGHNLYENLTVVDNSAKVAQADSIARNGIPLSNWAYFPGHLVLIFYHYYWAMLAEVVAFMSGSAHDTRASVLAGISFSGLLLVLGISFGASYFKTRTIPRRQMINYSLALLFVANFYVLFSFPINALSFFFHVPPLKLGASLCWWTADAVYPLIHSVFWVPHHVCGLICGLLASVFMLEASKDSDSSVFSNASLAALCLSSCMGLSAQVGVAFAASWALWGLFLLGQRQYKSFTWTVAISFASFLLSLPLMHEMVGGAKGAAGLILAVRRFEPLDWLVPALAHAPKFIHQIAYLFVLPVNYLVGFGFTLLGALFYWRLKKSSPARTPIERRELFLLIVTFATVILGTFVRSKFRGNDFGWRVMMPAEVAFIFWSAQFLILLRQQKRNLQLFSKAAIAIGVTTCVYALYLDRTAAAYFLPTELSYEKRSVYEALDKALPLNAVIQHNPHLIWFATEFYCNLYSHRQVAVAERLLTRDLNGVDFDEYDRVVTNVESLFGDITAAAAGEICKRYKINVLLVMDTDAIWNKPDAWFSHFPIVASGDHVRAYLVQPTEPVSGLSKGVL